MKDLGNWHLQTPMQQMKERMEMGATSVEMIVINTFDTFSGLDFLFCSAPREVPSNLRKWKLQHLPNGDVQAFCCDDFIWKRHHQNCTR
jgi:hypothetical protein